MTRDEIVTALRCCGWALSGAPAEVAIEILETALAVEEEKGDRKWTL